MIQPVGGAARTGKDCGLLPARLQLAPPKLGHDARPPAKYARNFADPTLRACPELRRWCRGAGRLTIAAPRIWSEPPDLYRAPGWDRRTKRPLWRARRESLDRPEV